MNYLISANKILDNWVNIDTDLPFHLEEYPDFCAESFLHKINSVLLLIGKIQEEEGKETKLTLLNRCFEAFEKATILKGHISKKTHEVAVQLFATLNTLENQQIERVYSSKHLLKPIPLSFVEPNTTNPDEQHILTPAEQHVLSVHSPYFSSLLSGNWNDLSRSSLFIETPFTKYPFTKAAFLQMLYLGDENYQLSDEVDARSMFHYMDYFQFPPLDNIFISNCIIKVIEDLKSGKITSLDDLEITIKRRIQDKIFEILKEETDLHNLFQYLHKLPEWLQMLDAEEVDLSFLGDNGKLVSLEKIMEGCPNIQTLTLPYCGLRSAFLNSEQLIFLKELNLPYGEHLTDSQLQSILSKTPNLKKLTISGCSRITDSSIDKITDLTELSSLNCEGCFQLTDVSLQKICEKLKKLEYLNINGFAKVTSSTFQELLKLSFLKQLHMNRSKLADEELKSILEQNTHLEYLSINQCNVTDKAFLEAVQIPRLKYLDAGQCQKIGEGFLEKISSIDSLEFLSLEKFAFHFSVFDKDRLEKVKKKMNEIFASLLNLCEVQLKSNYALTDEALISLISAPNKLQSLNIEGSPLISKPAIQQVETDRPNLQFVYEVKTFDIFS